jgi:hypothetical protein
MSANMNAINEELKKRGYFWQKNPKTGKIDICFCWERCFFLRSLTPKQVARASDLIARDKLTQALNELS